MKKPIMMIVLWCLCLGLPLPAAPVPQPQLEGRPVHATRMLAREARGSQAAARQAALAAHGLVVRRQYPLVPGLVSLDATPERAAAVARMAPAEQAAELRNRMEALRRSGHYEYVEPDYHIQLDAVPTDSRFTDGTLWGLRNQGQSNGVAGADADVVRAWDITTGSTSVIVAVVDTGIRYTHRDLAAQMWRNPGEIPGNGLDDDGNGYIDDVFGMNAITGSGNPMDDNNHGTHCAGTIGAAANDGQPLVGVAWQVRLMACKFLRSDGGGDTSDAIECVDYAVRMGARILNNSWGGGGFSQGLYDSIRAARDRGVLFVAAAGNDRRNTDLTPQYPSSYRLENIVAVAAIDRRDALASFSNYGTESVDLAAPGVDIYSSTAGSDTEYQVFSGTSMATPHVCGAAALVAARYPGISVAELRQRLLAGAVPTTALRQMCATGGRVSAFNALTVPSDGRLELSASVAGGRLQAGRPASFQVQVTDLLPVTNATVTGTVAGLTNFVFANNGVAPDAAANDYIHTKDLLVPAGVTNLVMTVTASAPGKVAVTNTLTWPVLVPPANDMFANGIVIAGSSNQVAGSNVDATSEAGEPNHAGASGGKSVWWRWTAPASGPVVIKTDGSDYDTTLGVYTGTAVGSLTLVASNDDSTNTMVSQVIFNAAAGTVYQIAVDGYAGSTGRIRLTVSQGGGGSLVPVNDPFAGRIALSGSINQVTGSNVGATSEAGEPNPAGVSGGKSVWWQWVAPAAGLVVISTEGSSYDTTLGVYTGTSVGSLTQVAANDDATNGAHSLVSFIATAGTAYQFAVDGYAGDAGSIRLTVSQGGGGSPAPVNDSFGARMGVSGTTAQVTGSNVGATSEAGEPNHAGVSGGKSVWWRWIAPAAGLVVISTEGSSYDTTLGVYTGTSVGSLTQVAANDDATNGAHSLVSFIATAGTAYQIAVDGFAGSTGSIRLTVTQSGGGAPAPVNDPFAGRIPLSGAAIQVTGSNVGATSEAGEPNPAGVSGGKSVWWQWTAPTTGPVVISTEGSGYDTTLGVYTGTSVGSLTQVAANDNSTNGVHSQVRFTATAGTAYQIAVDGFGGGAGSIALSITSSPQLVLTMEPMTAPSAGCRLRITGPAGRQLEVEASSDLVHWTTLATLVNTNGTVLFTDPTTGLRQRVYRVRQLP